MKKITLTAAWSAPQSVAPMIMGQYIIQRAPLRGTPNTLYTILHKGEVIGRQVSMPDVMDCDYHARHFALFGLEAAQSKIAAPSRPGMLTERIVDLLKVEKLSLGDIASSLRTAAEVVAPILTRLTRKQVITRSGRKGSYEYQANDLLKQAA